MTVVIETINPDGSISYGHSDTILLAKRECVTLWSKADCYLYFRLINGDNIITGLSYTQAGLCDQLKWMDGKKVVTTEEIYTNFLEYGLDYISSAYIGMKIVGDPTLIKMIQNLVKVVSTLTKYIHVLITKHKKCQYSIICRNGSTNVIASGIKSLADAKVKAKTHRDRNDGYMSKYEIIGPNNKLHAMSDSVETNMKWVHFKST